MITIESQPTEQGSQERHEGFSLLPFFLASVKAVCLLHITILSFETFPGETRRLTTSKRGTETHPCAQSSDCLLCFRVL